MILLAILAPPLYFLVRKKWISLLLTMFFMAFSTLLVVTIVMSPVILVFWGMSAAWAVLDDIDRTLSRQEPTLTHGKH